MTTDSRKGWRAGVENDETNLAAVTVFAEDAGVGRKTSPALDLRGYERRLEIRVVLLESARRELRRHIYIGLGFGKVSKKLLFSGFLEIHF
jgi:hypothetical protein